MIVVLANYLSARQGRLGSLWSILGACLLVGPPCSSSCCSRTSGPPSSSPRSSPGCSSCPGASLNWLCVLVGAGLAAMPVIWTYILRDYQKERLTAFLNPLGDIQGAGLPALPVADRGRLRGA